MCRGVGRGVVGKVCGLGEGLMRVVLSCLLSHFRHFLNFLDRQISGLSNRVRFVETPRGTWSLK